MENEIQENEIQENESNSEIKSSIISKVWKLIIIGIFGVGLYQAGKTKVVKAISYSFILLIFAWVILWVIVPKVISLKNTCSNQTAVSKVAGDIMNYIETTHNEEVTSKKVIERLKKENESLIALVNENKQTQQRLVCDISRANDRNKTVEVMIEEQKKTDRVLLEKLVLVNTNLNMAVKQLIELRESVEQQNETIDNQLAQINEQNETINRLKTGIMVAKVQVNSKQETIEAIQKSQVASVQVVTPIAKTYSSEDVNAILLAHNPPPTLAKPVAYGTKATKKFVTFR